MTRARAWLAQAESDLIAGNHLADRADARMYCQAIAKYQQTVEKSIKGLIDALNSSQASFGRQHSVERLLSPLLRSPRTGDAKAVSNQIRGLFSPSIRADIRRLDRLAPKWPAPGEPFSRNTEYPFQQHSGEWTAPAADRSFSQDEVERFGKTASRVFHGSGKLITTLERVKP